MTKWLLKKIFGSHNERSLKRIYNIVEQINAHEQEIKKLPDEKFRQKTDEYKMQLNSQKASLDDLLPEAFALVREAAWRCIGERPFDSQLIGGIILHQGKIAELKTGEGKTLMATMPAYLNALTGKGVHIVTVNDYLAQRDAEWMEPIYNMLGLEVGVVIPEMENDDKKRSYQKDIIYGTNNEFGFDYLRDNLKNSMELKVQREFNFCIVDEIDSILIDEARTPLIISGQTEDNIKKYVNIDKIVKYFSEVKKDENGRYPDEADPLNPQKPDGDYKIDEKSKNVMLTDQGMDTAEKILQERSIIRGSLYDEENFEYIHYLTNALRAHMLYRRDVEYVVKNNEVLIVDEFTGRTLAGRRYSDGLHQAIEAKENIRIARRSKTIATITFQNFFRMYTKLSGMTGTAETESLEFKKIYSLDTLVVPTNQPVIRKDYSDKIFLSERDKFKILADDIKEINNNNGAPILVGTASIEKSEKISELLKRKNIKHNVLNAKYHAMEATIVQEAGKIGAVTIATNMAGRGTDIKLGGARTYENDFEDLVNEYTGTDHHDKLISMRKQLDRRNWDELRSEAADLPTAVRDSIEKIIRKGERWLEEHYRVLALGGLHIIGTERHESRRVDNQLRGRSGRQGDPGMSRFYISLDDELMRLFGGEKLKAFLGGKKMESETEDEDKDVEIELEHPWLNRAIEKAQKKVEDRNFEIRKHLLEYDDVLNDQRNFVYSQRDKILTDNDLVERVKATTEDQVEISINEYRQNLKDSPDLAISELQKAIIRDFNIDLLKIIVDNQKNPDALQTEIQKILVEDLYAKQQIISPLNMNMLIQMTYIENIDNLWQDHLSIMDELREGVSLRSYSQKNPLVEYKLEGSKIFDNMIDKIRIRTMVKIFKIRIESFDGNRLILGMSDQINTHHAQMGQFDALRMGHDMPPQEMQRQAIQRQKQSRPSAADNVMNQVRRTDTKVGRNDPCPCGSGKKYKRCHGS